MLACAMLTGGCSDKTPALRVNPGDHLPFIQKFPRAYYSINSEGDYQIVMLSEGIQQSPKQGKILYPTNLGSIRQVVEIRLLWIPLPGTRTDQPTATNAVINWHVRSNVPEEADNKIDYSGAGFVSFYPKKTGAQIVIRNATMTLQNRSGNLVDVFGKPAVTGSFHVVRNDGVVKDILASLNPPTTGPSMAQR
jgi:hypothetical protein